MAIEDIEMQVVSLEKRIINLEIEDKDDAVFLNGLQDRVKVLEATLKKGCIFGFPVDWQAECRRLAAANDRLQAENAILIANLRSRGYVSL